MNENMNTCTECGCTGEELFELCVNGEDLMVCRECAENLGFVQCTDCGEWVPESEALTTDCGDYICQSCYEDDYFTCEECGEIHHLDDAETVDLDTRYEKLVCQDCAERLYYKCLGCGRYFSAYGADLHSGDDCVCSSCNRWENWHICYDCDRIFHEDDGGLWSEEDQEWYCDDCADDHRRAEGLHDYGYKPDPDFQYRMGEDTTKTFTFGAELEVDGGNDAGDLVRDLHNLDLPIYMKHDGSLGDEGVEIVTHPCSLAFHQYQLRWAEIARICKRNDYKSHDTTTCGLHIHVGRRQMGETWAERDRTAGNLVLLVNALWDKLIPFTRRKEEKLDYWAGRNQLCAPEILPELSDERLTDMALDTVHQGRYRAVNLANSETVEFRIFRGTLKRDTIIASIQLVNNLTRYAMTHTPTECLNAEWLDVLNIEEHKELRSYCESRNIAE